MQLPDSIPANGCHAAVLVANPRSAPFPLPRNLDLLLGLENRILYTAIDILDGECRLDQALIRDKRWKNLSLLSMSRNRQR